MADRLFHAIDSKNTGRISFDDFVVCLAVCCRGTLEEKMRFIFGVYDMDGVRKFRVVIPFPLCAMSGYLIDISVVVWFVRLEKKT